MNKNSQPDDVAFIKALAELLRENDLAELQVKRDYGEDSSLNVRLSRVMQSPPAQPAPTYHFAEAPRDAAPLPARAPEAGNGDPADHPGAVPSPMVGTVYLQSEPGTDPFVKVGSIVREGQTLLIVEAMKTMNQIPSPRSGTVTRILVGDGDPVEYGAPLLIIE
jgi:acetyl-CoA carboxylase biotin carboxyl carrier protein